MSEHENADSAITHCMAGIFAWLGAIQGEQVLIAVSIAAMVGRGVYDFVRFVHYMRDRNNGKPK